MTQKLTIVEITVAPRREGGSTHNVGVIEAEDGSWYLTCTCPAGRFAWSKKVSGRGCWAMQQVRDDLKIQPDLPPSTFSKERASQYALVR
jgi:hypothetical protein